MKKVAVLCGLLIVFLLTSQVPAADLVGEWTGTATLVTQKTEYVDVGVYKTLPVSLKITRQVGNRFEANTTWQNVVYKIYGVLNGDSVHASADNTIITGKLVDQNTMDLSAQVTAKGNTLSASGILKKQ